MQVNGRDKNWKNAKSTKWHNIYTTYLHFTFTMFSRFVACSMAKWIKTYNSFSLFLHLDLTNSCFFLLSSKQSSILSVSNAYLNLSCMFFGSGVFNPFQMIHRMSCDRFFFFLPTRFLSPSSYRERIFFMRINKDSYSYFYFIR